MQEYNEPMPGLLYEAELPAHAQHHRRRQPLSNATPTAATAVAVANTAAPHPVMGTNSSVGVVVASSAGAGAQQEEEEDELARERAPPSPLDPLLDGVAAQRSPGGTLTAAAVEAPQVLQQRPSPSLDSRLLEEGSAEHHHQERGQGQERGGRRPHHHPSHDHHAQQGACVLS